MRSEHFRHNELAAYLEGSLPPELRSELAEHIKTCNDCFQEYMNAREAVFLQKSGEKIPMVMRDFVLNRIKQNRESHLSIIVRFLKDRVSVFSGDQETLSYQGIQAGFAFRGSGVNAMSASQEGPISITRTVQGREVTLTLHPQKASAVGGLLPQKIGLSIVVNPTEKLRAAIFFDGEEVEIITDTSQQSLLRQLLPRQGNVEIQFSKDGKDVFSIALALEAGE